MNNVNERGHRMSRLEQFFAQARGPRPDDEQTIRAVDAILHAENVPDAVVTRVREDPRTAEVLLIGAALELPPGLVMFVAGVRR